MYVVIGEDFSHFTEEVFQEVERGISAGIHGSKLIVWFASTVAFRQNIQHLTP